MRLRGAAGLVVRLCLTLLAAGWSAGVAYQLLLRYEVAAPHSASPFTWFVAPATPARQGAWAVLAVIGPLWWIFFTEIKELWLRWRIHRQDPLSYRAGRDAALQSIQKILTEAQLGADQQRLAAVAAPAGYAPAYLARTERWLADLTVLTRGNFGLTVAGMDVATELSQVPQLAQMQALAADVADAQQTFQADELVLRQHPHLDLADHPTVRFFNQAAAAAQALTRQLPAYAEPLNRVQQVIAEALALANEPINSAADAVSLLSRWDTAAHQVSLLTDAIAVEDRFVERGWDEATGMIALRPEVACLQQVGHSRAVAQAQPSALAVAGSATGSDGATMSRPGPPVADAGAAAAASSPIDTQERERQLRQLRTPKDPSRTWGVQVQLLANPGPVLTVVTIALLAAGASLWLGWGDGSPGQRIYFTVFVAIAVAVLVAFGVSLIGSSIKTSRASNRNLSSEEQAKRLNPGMTALVMCEDLVTLAVNQTLSDGGDYAPVLQERFNQYLQDRDELLRLTGFTGTHLITPEGQGAAATSGLDIDVMVALMGVVQAELDGLWCACDILAAKPGWQQRWHSECDRLADLSRYQIRVEDAEVLSGLREALLTGSISPTEALQTLDLLAEDYRLLRRVRGLVSGAAHSRTKVKLIDDAKLAHEYRRALHRDAQLSALKSVNPIALANGFSLTRPALYDTVDRSIVVFFVAFYPFWAMIIFAVLGPSLEGGW